MEHPRSLRQCLVLPLRKLLVLKEGFGPTHFFSEANKFVFHMTIGIDPQTILENISSLNPDIADGARHEMILDYFQQLKSRNLHHGLDLGSLRNALHSSDYRVVSLAIRIFALFPLQIPDIALSEIFGTLSTFAVLEFIRMVFGEVELDKPNVEFYIKRGLQSSSICDFESVLKLVPLQCYEIKLEWIPDALRRVRFLEIRMNFQRISKLEWNAVLCDCLRNGDDLNLTTASINLLLDSNCFPDNLSFLESVLIDNLTVQSSGAVVMALALYCQSLITCGNFILDALYDFSNIIMLLLHESQTESILSTLPSVLKHILEFLATMGRSDLIRIKPNLEKYTVGLIVLLSSKINAKIPKNGQIHLLKWFTYNLAAPNRVKLFNAIKFCGETLDYSSIRKLLDHSPSRIDILLHLVSIDDLKLLLGYVLELKDWRYLDDSLCFLVDRVSCDELVYTFLATEFVPRLIELASHFIPSIRVLSIDILKVCIINKAIGLAVGDRDDVANLLQKKLHMETHPDVLVSLLQLYAVFDFNSIVKPSDLCEFINHDDFNVRIAAIHKFSKIYQLNKSGFLLGPYFSAMTSLLDDYCWKVRKACLDLLYNIYSDGYQLEYFDKIDFKREYERCDPLLLSDDLNFSISILQEFDALGEGNNVLQCYDC